MENHAVIRDLGEGLVLRSATIADADALAKFNSEIHGNQETKQPDERVGAWTRDLLAVPHPTFKPGDFTIVEDTRTGKVVSSLNLIAQSWSYAGISFPVGRPELVGTDPEYRNRGLIRAQFEVIHQWSAARGHKLQAITGIPYYYRLFGYEMALDLDGGRAGYAVHVPKLKEGEEESYNFRPAQQADWKFVADLYQHASQRYLVQCQRDERLWKYELSGKSANNVNRRAFWIIETLAGEPVGYVGTPSFAWGEMMVAQAYEILPGFSWGEITPAVIRFLVMIGQEHLDKEGKGVQLGAFGFWLGLDHPVYQVARDRLPRVRTPYAWYLRITDLPDFLRLLSPVLEERLSRSLLVGYSGEMKITFYRDGLRMVFEKGKLNTVEPWRPEPEGYSGNAAFPGLTFLQLLFGFRSLEELRFAFPDCWVNGDQNRCLLEALFPKHLSVVWPVD